MRIGNVALDDTRPDTIATIKVGTQLVWQRQAEVAPGELVIATDGFLVKEPDGYLVL